VTLQILNLGKKTKGTTRERKGAKKGTTKEKTKVLERSEQGLSAYDNLVRTKVAALLDVSEI
jgi:hypothetical protein